MDNSHGTPVDETRAEVPLEDHTGQTPTEEEDATYDSDLDQFIEILPARLSQALETMAAMPWKRHVALRSNKQCIIEPGARRNCNQEAALCQTRGDICEEPCLPCGRGNGIFAQYIVVPGQFDGACGSCRYNARHAQCSLCNSNVGNLKRQVENLQEKVAGLTSANRELADEIEALVGMSFEELEKHKAHLNAALMMIKLSKGTSS